ncbi:ATP-binding protein [Limosilactobacillus fermentum]
MKGLNLPPNIVAMMKEQDRDPTKDPAVFAEMKKRKEEREQRLISEWNKEIRQEKLKSWLRDSIWSGSRPLNFTFERWKPDIQANTQLARKVGNSAWKLANRMVAGEQFNVLMYGEPGTGKTSLALAIADKVFKDAEKPYLFISTIKIFGMFSERFDNPEVGHRLKDLQKKAKQAPILIIDDFGTEAGMKIFDKSTGKAHFNPVRKDMQEWLYEVADARYDEYENAHHGSTIVTTNNTSGDLVQMYNPKLISRMITKRKENTIDFKGLDDMRG